MHGSAEANPSGLLRFAWVFTGAVLPVICFFAGIAIFRDRTRSLSGYAGLLLSFDGSLPLMPLLLICMGSIVALASRPGDARNGWVRLGVFSGVVLSVEYWCLLQVALGRADSWSSLVACLVWGGIWSSVAIVVAWFFGHLAAFSFTLAREGSFGCASVGIFGFGVIVVITLPYSVVAMAVVCLLCATPWAVAAYVSAAVWLVRHRKGKAFQFTLWQLLAATTWLAVHFAAWRTAVLMMLGRAR